MEMCRHDSPCGCLGWTRLGKLAFPCEVPLRDRRRLIGEARRAVVGMEARQRAAFLALAFCGVPADVLAECTGEPASELARAASDARARRRQWLAQA